jgi:phage gp29-like protein
MLSPLISLLENCETFDEAYELLTDKNLKSKKFEQCLQKALFLSELQGRSDGLDE